MGKITAIALCDCNRFYVACERAAVPGIWDRPVIVLSNNDGSIVSISEEAEAVGLAKGMPYFRVRETVKEHKVRVFSSNYTLYGSLSKRVMDTLRTLSPGIEIYSIDEAFLDLSHIDADRLDAHARHIRRVVKRWTGVGISIGIAETKTLAKVANRLAKKTPALEGVMDLTGNRVLQEAALTKLPVGDVWGIGSRWEKALAQDAGVTNALQLRDLSDLWVKKRMGVVGMRTVLELRGLPCLPLQTAAPRRKSACVSRSFGRPVCDRQG